MKRRAAAIVSVIGAVIVLAGAAWVIHKKNPVPNAGQTPGSTTVPTVSSSLSPSPSPSGTTSVSAPPITTAFIGDDYTLGSGASTTSKAFAPLVASQSGLSAKTYGVSGGGYAKPDANGHTYADLISQAVASHPAVIIVTGGRNDEFDNPDSLASAVTAFFAQLHTAAPYATLVAVTPFFGDSPSPTAIVKLAAQVHNAVKGVGGQFIDLPDPLLGHSSYMASATEPNDTGYAAIASALSAKLKPVISGLQRGGAPHSSSGSPSGSGSSSSSASG